MSKLIVRLAGAAVLGGLVAAPSYASTATGDLGVSATVTSNCTLSTSPVAFGNVDVTSGSNVDATGSIGVTCTSGTAWDASADAGSGTGATLDTRKMTSGTNLLNYVLYTDSARSTVWGDGVDSATSLISDTGSGVEQTKTIYGRVPSGQTGVPAGSYADTVAVTVTY
jgi:spore coat protein U-like protein